MKTFKVLSIDAWADIEPDSWTWNAWYNAGSIDLDSIDLEDREIISRMAAAGYLNPSKIDLVDLDDDQHNLILVNRETREPLFAIPYMDDPFLENHAGDQK